MSYNLRLLVACPDARGLVAAISSFIMENGGNILSADQYVRPGDSLNGGSPDGGAAFFMRTEIEGAGFELADEEKFARAFAPVAERYGMEWSLGRTDRRKRMAVLVSRYDHCLIDLLWRWEAGELDVELPLVISNHPDLAGKAESAGVPYYHLPVEPGKREDQEQRVLELLAEHEVDFVVLARYMQILSPRFVGEYPDGIINIHHSFLPAFAGADPYRRAYERGVKIIGATAHYVTEELDGGPIVNQDVVHVTHRESVADLVRVGREVERRVLARAVRWHIEDRVLVDGPRTVIFE